MRMADAVRLLGQMSWGLMRWLTQAAVVGGCGSHLMWMVQRLVCERLMMGVFDSMAAVFDSIGGISIASVFNSRTAVFDSVAVAFDSRSVRFHGRSVQYDGGCI